jgi:hypothetical protein
MKPIWIVSTKGTTPGPFLGALTEYFAIDLRGVAAPRVFLFVRFVWSVKVIYLYEA